MKTHFYLLCLFIVLLISPSCLTVVEFQVKHPAELTFAEENTRFVFINTFDLAELNLSDEKKIAVYNSGIENIQLSLEETFQEDAKIEYVVCNSSIQKSADSLFESSKNPDYTKYICEEYGATHMLELDRFALFFDSHMNESEDDFDEDDSNEIKIRSFTITVDADFKLYSKDGKLFNQSTVTKSKHHKSRLVLIQWIELTPSLKKAGENVNVLSRSIGVEYRARFYPNLENVKRNYYSGKDFKEIKPLIKNKEWHKARDALLVLSESTDPSISQKQVAHNLYVVYKALGDNEASDYWLLKSGNRQLMFQEGLENF